MDLKQRLIELTKEAGFRFVTDFDSVSQLTELADYNMAQYERLKAMGEAHLERIHDLVFLLLAKEVQPRARKAHGSISDASVRQLLQDEFNRPESKSAQEKWKRLVKEAMAAQGLTPDQLAKLDGLLEQWPDLLIEAYVEGIGLFRRIPAVETSRLAALLSEMFLEEAHVDSSRRN